MAKKPPRRTAERILETTLALFNRFGAPNVTTAQISAELSISPGNLYYHYPAKEELVNALFERYRLAMDTLLEAGPDVRDVEDAWFFLHSVFELIWQYRFFYRDLNDLLSNNLLLETHFKTILADKNRAVRGLLDGMGEGGVLCIAEPEAEATATGMVVLLTYWLSYEYVRNPRHALEPEAGQQAVLRGAHHVLNLLAPYLADSSRAHLLTLVDAYRHAVNTQSH